MHYYVFFFQAEDGIRDKLVTGVQTCALPISRGPACSMNASRSPSQKLECTTSALAPSTVEISALYCPAKSFGICEVATWTPGVSCFIDASKSTQESWPQA